MKNSLSLLLFFVLTIAAVAPTYGQNPSAITEFESTDKGVLIPRMTTTQRDNIDDPAEGLLVYDTDLEVFYYFSESGGWTEVGGGGGSSSSPSVIGASIFPNNEYGGPWTNNNNSSEIQARFPMPAGTLSELRAFSSGTSDDAMTITVFHEGSATSISCVIAAGNNSCTDLVDSQVFAAGEGLTFRLQVPGSNPGTYVRITTKWVGQ